MFFAFAYMDLPIPPPPPPVHAPPVSAQLLPALRIEAPQEFVSPQSVSGWRGFDPTTVVTFDATEGFVGETGPHGTLVIDDATRAGLVESGLCAVKPWVCE